VGPSRRPHQARQVSRELLICGLNPKPFRLPAEAGSDGKAG